MFFLSFLSFYLSFRRRWKIARNPIQTAAQVAAIVSNSKSLPPHIELYDYKQAFTQQVNAQALSLWLHMRIIVRASYCLLLFIDKLKGFVWRFMGVLPCIGSIQVLHGQRENKAKYFPEILIMSQVSDDSLGISISGKYFALFSL